MSGGPRRKVTRRGARCPFVGSSRELPLSEPRTLLEILAYGNLLEERNDGNLSLTDKVKVISEKVKSIFTKVGTNLPLMSDKSIFNKVKKAFDTYRELKRKQLKDRAKQCFLNKFELVFDIIKCQCPIKLCEEIEGCDGCSIKAHISCKCGSAKIPLEDLHFVWDQRQRCEGRPSSYQIQNVDVNATRRVAKVQQREQNRGSRLARQSLQFNDVPEFVPLSSSSESEAGDDEDPELQLEEPSTSGATFSCVIADLKKLSLQKVASEAERFKFSNRGVSCICTALLGDLGIINDDCTDMIIDKSKIHRNREKLRKNEVLHPPLSRTFIQGLEYDGRKDKTLVYNAASKGNRYVEEEHFSVLQQPRRHFLTHFTPASGKSVDICEDLTDVVVDNGLQPCLKRIGCDSTNVNTGAEGGVNTLQEQKLDHRLLWHICSLHTGELPLRHLVIDLDGPTSGKDSFSGPVGKLAKRADSLPPASHFEAISPGIPMRSLPPAVVNDLSTDQKFLYKITTCIHNSSADISIYSTKIGPMDHSRWLTLASRMCRLYISDHKLEGDAKNNLKSIVTFVVKHYSPMWFDVKCEPLYTDGPRHVLSSIQRFKLLPENIIANVNGTKSRTK